MAPSSWVYVTGCDSGFGSIVVQYLTAKGFGVFATHLLPESADKLRAAGDHIFPLHVDITKQESVDAAAQEISAKLAADPAAQLYGLVNNAGLLYRAGPVEWTPAINFEKMMQVNVIGAARVTNSVLPHLRRSKGRIVNVASIAGRLSMPSQAAYCASKHAMEGYSDGLRRELFDWGVTVHIIEPGIFKSTGLYATFRDGVNKLWEECPANIKADYGEGFRDGFASRCNKGLEDFGSTDSTLVPKAMIQALTEKRPRYRYLVGTDAKILVPLFKWLHESWADWILRQDVGHPGRLLAATMDPKARQIANARYRRGGGTFKKIAILAFLFFFVRMLRKS